jgi:hypothetical protein
MNSKSHYLYISSKNRSENENIYNFNVILNNPIILNRNQGINISVIGFSMMNTDYNLRNISFELIWMDYANNITLQTDIIEIPDGNYSYLTFLDYLNNILSGLIKVEYVKERNSYKFKNIDIANHDFIIRPKTAGKYLGLTEDLILNDPDFHEGSYINLSNYSHIIIKSNNIFFEDNQEDNINNKEMGSSSILFMLDKQDIPPFQLISYRNFDKSDNYSYNISNRQINSIDLHLYNEKGEVLTNTDDYFLTLKIVIFNKEEIKADTSFLEDIRFLIMDLMFNKKNLILR